MQIEQSDISYRMEIRKQFTLHLHLYHLPQTCFSAAYTLSYPENDRDITEHAHGYTLQDTSFMRQSRCSFLNAWENAQVARTMTSVFIWNTRWRHGRSRVETKYTHTDILAQFFHVIELYYILCTVII